MNFLKSLIAVAAIAAAFSEQVIADEAQELSSTCYSLYSEMWKQVDLSDGDKAFEFVKQELKTFSWVTSSQYKKITDAWDHIYHGKDCSEKSWEYLVDLSICNGGLSKPEHDWHAHQLRFKVLNEPFKAYVKKCVKPADLDKRINSEVSGSRSGRLDFIDSQFITKYRQDNPDDVPMHKNWIDRSRYEIEPHCCKPYDSLGAVNDAFERNLKKMVKDPKEFCAKPTDVSKYLKKKLFEPCSELKRSFKPLALNLGMVGEHYEGGVEGLIASLSQEARDNLFKYKYCQYFDGHEKSKLVLGALEKFVPERELTNKEKRIIRRDCGL